MLKIGYLSVIFMWSLLYSVLGYGDQALKDRVSILEEKVEELESESLTRDRLIKLLSQGSNSGIGDNSQGGEIAWDQSPVTIVEVRRDLMVDGTFSLFTVKYKRNVPDVMTVWSGKDATVLSNDIELDDGIYETSFNVDAPGAKSKRDEEDWDFNLTDFNLTSLELLNFTDLSIPNYEPPVTVSFSSNNGLSLFMQLSNHDSDDEETDISTPLIKVEPEGDFVYQEGEDVTFKITTPPAENFPLDRLSVQQCLLHQGEGRVKMIYGMSDLVEITGNKSYPEYQEWYVKIRTSENRASGFIDVSARSGIQEEKSDLVNLVMLSKIATLRPSTQDGPFPTGFIDVVRLPWWRHETPGDIDSPAVISCHGDEWCQFTCVGVGDDIIRINVYKVDPDGTKTSISELPNFSALDITVVPKYYRQQHVTFHTDAMDGDRARFSCVATRNFGTTATLEIITDKSPDYAYGFARRDTEASQIFKPNLHGSGNTKNFNERSP